MAPEVGPARRAGVVLAAARAATEPVYREVVDQLPEEIRRIAGYHCGWWDASGESCEPSGKAVRPAFALACAAAECDDSLPTAAPVAAVAVELVHDFSLLHDDVMGGDLTRRHRSAAWVVFGVGTAVLVGDMMVMLGVAQRWPYRTRSPLRGS